MLKTIICGHCFKAHSEECFWSLNDNLHPSPHERLVSTHPRPLGIRFAPCNGIRTAESGKCSLFVQCVIREIPELCNRESWVTESGTQLKESGIPLTIGIRNTFSSTNKEPGIQFLESGIHDDESRIQDCLGFPCMERYDKVWSIGIHFFSSKLSDMRSSVAQNAVVEPKRLHPLY